MKKNDKMPTARVCDLLSVLVAASGVYAACVYFIPRPINISSVTAGLFIILGSFVMAAIVRILGIMGQNLFNLVRDINGTLGVTLRNSMEDLGKGMEDLRKDAVQHVEDLRKDAVQHVEDLRKDAVQHMEDLRKDAVQHTLQLRELLDQFNGNARDINEAIRDPLRNSLEDIRKDVGRNTLQLGSILDQVNCDTRDLNENIRQIKTFFEQIERHLDLKK